LDFVTTNNEAKYEALLAGLSIAREMGAKNVEIRSDSQVVVSHIQGLSEAQGEKMIQYLNKVREYQSNFGRTALTKILREDNVQADALSKMGSRTRPVVKTSAYEVVVQTEPSISPKLDMMEIEERSTDPEWATDVVQYLRNGSLPGDKLLSHKVKMHSARTCSLGGYFTKEDIPSCSSSVSQTPTQNMCSRKYMKGFAGTIRALGCWRTRQ
jgi:hypothetical protein